MMSAPESQEKEKRFVYNKDFLLKRKDTAASKFWPKSLSKQHINGLGLWDPVSFCKYVAKEEKLKRNKKAGPVNSEFHRTFVHNGFSYGALEENTFDFQRTREVRDAYNNQIYYPATSFNGYSSRGTNVCYLRNNYDAYYENDYDRYGVYEYVEAEGDYYPPAQPIGRKRSSRPRRTRLTGRSSALGSNIPMGGEPCQPEWFSCGPTSHLDMINLEGFPSKTAQTDNTMIRSNATDSSNSPVSMEVVLGISCATNNKENSQSVQDLKVLTDATRYTDADSQNSTEQYERDMVSKHLLRLIQNGPQSTSMQIPPHLPPEVKDAATSAELENALKGLLFKEKDSNAKQNQEDIFVKLRAKASFPRHLRVGFYKKCMMNGQVKTVAELEGHQDTSASEKEGDKKDGKSGIKSQGSAQQKVYSNPDSGDQSAYYRLIGMMRANGSFDDMPTAKYRGSGNVVPYKTNTGTQNGAKLIPSSGPSMTKTSTNKNEGASNYVKQGHANNLDCDNTNNNSIKQTSSAATVAAVAAAAAAASRLQNPLAQSGLFRSAHPTAAAAAAVAASMAPLLPQQHGHVPHLLPPHSQFLSAALFKQLPQAQAHLSSQQAFGSMTNRQTKPCIPQTPLLYYAMAQQAQLQQHQQQQQQQKQQQQQLPHQQQTQSQQQHQLQHQHQKVQNIVGKAAVALHHQASKSQQVYRWFRAWSNATAAKVCIKKNSHSPDALKSVTMSDNFNTYRNGNIKDGKKTLSDSDISNSVNNNEPDNNQQSAHSTPGRRVCHHPDSEDIQAPISREQEIQSSQTFIEANRNVVPNTAMPSVRPSTLSHLPALGNVSSAYTLVPPQRIAPPMQSSVAAINNLFRLPQGYSPSLPPSMRLHQTATNSNSESVQVNGGLGKWFGSDLIGTHRLIGLPPLPTEDASGRVRTVDDIERRC